MSNVVAIASLGVALIAFHWNYRNGMECYPLSNAAHEHKTLGFWTSRDQRACRRACMPVQWHVTSIRWRHTRWAMAWWCELSPVQRGPSRLSYDRRRLETMDNYTPQTIDHTLRIERPHTHTMRPQLSLLCDHSSTIWRVCSWGCGQLHSGRMCAGRWDGALFASSVLSSMLRRLCACMVVCSKRVESAFDATYLHGDVKDGIRWRYIRQRLNCIEHLVSTFLCLCVCVCA
jgi:hypothetical protein